MLLVPSAFTKTTGEAHWELLLRTRAVETQCYVRPPPPKLPSTFDILSADGKSPHWIEHGHHRCWTDV